MQSNTRKAWQEIKMLAGVKKSQEIGAIKDKNGVITFETAKKLEILLKTMPTSEEMKSHAERAMI